MELDYLSEFKKAANLLDVNILQKKKMEIETGIWLDSVVLRLQKNKWANNPTEKPHSSASIFFSIWVNGMAEKDNKILYNIHALKLRQLKGYTLTSRNFASGFRENFKAFEPQWPNVSVKFGPQTLMQGWKTMNLNCIQQDILELANKFLEIDFLIDELLDKHKLP